MASPVHHAISSAKKFGGIWEDYISIHSWFDASKGLVPDARHRAVRHHSEGIFVCERVFGPAFNRVSDGKLLPTRWIGEQHVQEDFGGFIPTLRDWFKEIDTSEPEELWPSFNEWINICEDEINIYTSADGISIQNVLGVEYHTSKLYRWLHYIKLRPWMARSALKLSEELEKAGLV